MQQLSLSPRLFDQIAELVYCETGIRLKQTSKATLIARLTKRIHQLGLISFAEYFNYLSSETVGHGETEQLINTITTNTTEFYRERHHFDFLRSTVMSLIAPENERVDRVLRIWSSACSTGEEPYTIAMTIKDLLSVQPQWRLQILASDVDTAALNYASRGIFGPGHLKGISAVDLETHFTEINTRNEEINYKVSPELRAMIAFQQINLISHPFRFKAQLDVIFCRNVFVYFDEVSKKKLIAKFSRSIRPGGYLIIGQSETLTDDSKAFTQAGTAIYKRSGLPF